MYVLTFVTRMCKEWCIYPHNKNFIELWACLVRIEETCGPIIFLELYSACALWVHLAACWQLWTVEFELFDWLVMAEQLLFWCPFDSWNIITSVCINLSFLLGKSSTSVCRNNWNMLLHNVNRAKTDNVQCFAASFLHKLYSSFETQPLACQT